MSEQDKHTINTLNPDAMNVEELETFAHSARGLRPVTKARNFFCGTPRGYVSAFKNIRHYCSNKAVAMRCRARGEITTAQQYESICERIYNELPDYAKW